MDFDALWYICRAMHLLRAAIILLWLAVCGWADSYVRQPLVDVIHYDISLELTDASDSISGTTRVHVRIREDGASGMWLDFSDMEVHRLLVEGAERRFTYGDGRLSFEFGKTCSRGEIVVLEVHYHGKPRRGLLIGNNSHGRRVFFSHSWPDRAHHWFPSIDHPSDKATADISVTAPEKYDTVSNGRLVETVSLQDGRRLTRWSESVAIPVYCIAIGVAEFSIAHQPETEGMPVAWYSYPQDAGAAAAKFGRTASAISYFRNLIGPYPYEKLAQVESNIEIAAMENASAIFYNELLFHETPVSGYPVPHEIAHQWFGNSITEADWDHLWLSEGFASYFEALFYEYLGGPEALKQAMARYKENLLRYELARAAPIVDPGLTDLIKKLSPLNYVKGAWVLHMLRGLIGDEKFFERIRRYYRTFKNGTVLSDDFREIMESVSGTSLSAFFKQWLYQAGWPDYSLVWRWDEAAREAEITVRQTQSTGLFDMPVEVALLYGTRREILRFRISSPTHTFRLPLAAKPSSVEIDPDGWILKSQSGNN